MEEFRALGAETLTAWSTIESLGFGLQDFRLAVWKILVKILVPPGYNMNFLKGGYTGD